jgi:hypothetical protein
MWKTRTRRPRGAVRFRCGEGSHSQDSCLIRLKLCGSKSRCRKETDDHPASHLNQQSIIRLTLVFALFSPFPLRFHPLGSKASMHQRRNSMHADPAGYWIETEGSIPQPRSPLLRPFLRIAYDPLTLNGYPPSRSVPTMCDRERLVRSQG